MQLHLKVDYCFLLPARIHSTLRLKNQASCYRFRFTSTSLQEAEEEISLSLLVSSSSSSSPVSSSQMSFFLVPFTPPNTLTCLLPSRSSSSVWFEAPETTPVPPGRPEWILKPSLTGSNWAVSAAGSVWTSLNIVKNIITAIFSQVSR